MITDEQLRAAIEFAGDELVVPNSGRESILGRALEGGPSGITDSTEQVVPRRSRRGRILVAVAAGVAAAVVISVIVVSTRQPALVKTQAGGLVPTAGGAASRSVLGVNAAPADHAASSRASLGINDTEIPSPASVVPQPVTQAPKPAKIASTGTLTLSISRRALDHDVQALDRLASSTGGFVASTNVSQIARVGRATVTLSVPAASFQTVISEAEGLGGLRSLVTSNRDVTSEHAPIRRRSCKRLKTSGVSLKPFSPERARTPISLTSRIRFNRFKPRLTNSRDNSDLSIAEITYASLSG